MTENANPADRETYEGDFAGDRAVRRLRIGPDSSKVRNARAGLAWSRDVVAVDKHDAVAPLCQLGAVVSIQRRAGLPLTAMTMEPLPEAGAKISRSGDCAWAKAAHRDAIESKSFRERRRRDAWMTSRTRTSAIDFISQCS